MCSSDLPLAGDLLPKQPPPLEAHVVDLCDKIAYLSHDLDDGLRAGLFTTDDAAPLRLWQLASAATDASSRLRVVSEVVALLIHDLVDATDRALTARLPGSAPPRIAHSPEMTVAAQELLEFLRQRFYRSERVLLVMRDGAERIRRRFAAFVQDPHKLPPSHRDRIEREGQIGRAHV